MRVHIFNKFKAKNVDVAYAAEIMEVFKWERTERKNRERTGSYRVLLTGW